MESLVKTLEKERDYYKSECETLQDMMRRRLTGAESPSTKRKGGKGKGKVNYLNILNEKKKTDIWPNQRRQLSLRTCTNLGWTNRLAKLWHYGSINSKPAHPSGICRALSGQMGRNKRAMSFMHIWSRPKWTQLNVSARNPQPKADSTWKFSSTGRLRYARILDNPS